MSSFTAIADLGQSIVNLLRENLVPEPIMNQESIGMCSPVDKGDYSLGIYIYSIRENGENRPTEMIVEGKNKKRYPPFSLTVNMMITPYSKSEVQSRALDDQRILGKVIEVFHDNRRLTEESVSGVLKRQAEPIDINNMNLSFEEQIRIWSMFNEPYRLSMFYSVGPIYINSTKILEVKRVKSVDIKIKGR